MTKQATVELLKNQLPGFYSLEQVIAIIDGIDEPAPVNETFLSAGVGEGFIQNLLDSIADKMDGRHSNLVDLNSAEFELNGNEISLENVDVDTEEILARCEDAIRPIVQDFFQTAFLPKQA